MVERQQIQRADPGADPGADLEELVGYNLKRAYLVMQTDFRESLGQDGLAPREFSALSLIMRFPNVTQSELARMLGIDRSGLVAIIDALEQRAYLERARVPGDRRVQALVPTPMGTEAYTEALQTVRAHEELLLSDLSGEEKQILMDLLRKIRSREAVAEPC